MSASAKPATTAKPDAGPATGTGPAAGETPAQAGAQGRDEGATAKPGTKPGTGGGDRGGDGRAGGGDRETEHGWYLAMLHDRFYSRWQQPTSIISSEQQFVATIRIRIEPDGRVADATLLDSSGNVVMDESVLAAARQVTHVDPPPKGLGDPAFEVAIKFELKQN